MCTPLRTARRRDKEHLEILLDGATVSYFKAALESCRVTVDMRARKLEG
jgi:hypothetical protein